MERMRISELAERTGVPASTLRYYESEGLLPAERAENGYRIYGPPAVDRLAFIAQAKHLDLPLTSVRELVEAWESEPCHSVRAKYRPMLDQRAQQVDERLAALRGLQETLTTALQRLDALPDRDDPCDAACTFLDRDRPSLPLVSTDPAPIACSLGSGDYSARVQEWRELLDGAPRAAVEGGMRATLPTSALERATALAAAEQGCCAFYSIRLDLHGLTFDLTITAPPEGASMLADLLPTTENAAR